jgi:DNA mismatch repair protein MutL
VRFRYPLMIRDLVFTSIKGLLGSSSQVTEPIALGSFSSSIDFPKQSAEPTLFSGFHSSASSNVMPPRSLFEPPAPEFLPSLGFACFQIGDSFIVSRSEGCIIITDQSAAHERMIYEALKGTKQLASKVLENSIKVAVFDPIHFLENQALLEDFGLFVEAKGSNVIVKSIPLILFDCCIETLVKDLKSSFLEDLRASEAVRKVWSCHYASKKRLNLEEMNVVLRQLESTPNSDQNIHGRPCYIKLSKAQVEKWFEG